MNEQSEATQLWRTRVEERWVEGQGTSCKVLYGDDVGCSVWQQRGAQSRRYRVFSAGSILALGYTWSNARGVYRRELVLGAVCGEPLERVPGVQPGLELLLCARGKKSFVQANAYLELCIAAALMERRELHQRAHQWLLAGRDARLLVGRYLDSFGQPRGVQR